MLLFRCLYEKSACKPGKEKSNSDGEGEVVVDGEAEVEEVRGEGEEVSGQDAVVVLDDVAVMESVFV